jgi:hypothetical protein
MQKVRLYWEFYKSTLILNLASSVFLSFILMLGMQMIMKAPPPFIVIYIRCCMFGGPIVSLYYKETSRNNEYYFYYNKGISKISLLIITFIAYILIGILLLSILHYV